VQENLQNRALVAEPHNDGKDIVMKPEELEGVLDGLTRTASAQGHS
jgi:hypothetical protein